MNSQVIGGKAANLLALRSIVRVKPFITIETPEVLEISSAREIKGSVRTNLNALPRSLFFAVRSSAVGEDSTRYSWAGQFETVLDVPFDHLDAAILRCIDSASSAAVQSYGGFHEVDSAGLAVIVQEMVNASCAGALFTKNPVGSDEYLVVEAVAGNAECLVSGKVEPTRYYLDTDGRIVRIEGENDFRLTDEQSRELFNTAILIKHTLGSEQDIEWAFEEGTGLLFINQSRPITTLEDVWTPAAVAAGEVRSGLSAEYLRLARFGCQLAPDVLSNQNIAELLTSHPTRMAHGLFRYLFADGEGAIKRGRNLLGYEIGDELNSGFHVRVAGRPMMSVIHDAFTYRIRGIPLPDYCKIVNEYLARINADESLANYPEIRLYDQNISFEKLEHLFGREKAATFNSAYAAFFENLRRHEKRVRWDCLDRFLPAWTTLIESHRDEHMTTLAEAGREYRTLCNVLRAEACTMFVQVTRIGFFAYARARDALIGFYGPKSGEHFLNTLLGYSSEDLPNYRFSLALARVRAGEISLDEVVREFGHLAEHELEISSPRYRERRDILETLASKIESPKKRSKESAAAASALARELRGGMGVARWSSFDEDLETARVYLGLREVVKFHYLKGYEILRSLVVSMGRMLGWEEGLIFHLDPTEVFELATSADKLHGIAVLARAQQQDNKGIVVPPVLFADQLEAIGRPINSGSGALKGIGVTNQVCEGTCVVVKNLDDSEGLAAVKAGSILVTENTDPAWSPVIALLGRHGGLVTEIGGLLAHTAICAREQGIAAVLNITNATSILKTGMRLRVDGPRGLVEIL